MGLIIMRSDEYPLIDGQRIAIYILSCIHGMSEKELIQSALNVIVSPCSINELTYAEAKEVIKYGNILTELRK